MISQIKYDVFLNFKGEDTRDNFTSHLYYALYQKKIQTFIDYELKRGDEISPSLFDAIEASHISVVIFSKTYAGSKWCLEELVKIMECKNKHGQIVIPVFYGVDPSDVRNQTGIFGDSFSKLKEQFQERSDKLHEWRITLREAANISGFDSSVTRPESLLVQKIMRSILDRLRDTFKSDNKELVGIESRVKEIESLLSIELRDVCILGIWGIGGIGKTTIASVIFNKISEHFEGCYFVQNIREAEKNRELCQLQRELFSTILEEENVKSGIPNLNFESKRLNDKRVLIVLDDVTHLRQIEFLIGDIDRFGSGSRIIITSRDKQVLQNCRVNKIYKMQELVYSEAHKLFSQYAFGQNIMNESYVELSKKVIQYAYGVPLALKVLGCFLFGKNKEIWESTINKLERIPNAEIQEVLKISYNDLDDNQKNLFLNIVFFFVGMEKDSVIKFLDGWGFFSETEMNVLVNKSLIAISKEFILVHDLLQTMGREIVRQESINNPGKRSRLYHHQDIHEVLKESTGTEAIQGISLDMSKIEEIHLNPHTFKKMINLRFLRFYSLFPPKNKCKVSHIRGPTFTKLIYFQWDGYPLKSLPSSFNADNLISLIIPDSNIRQLWDGIQNLDNLKEMDLRGSKQLIKLPDLSRAINLVSLILNGCSNLQRLPDELGNLESLEKLYADKTAIVELPSSIGCLSKLRILQLRDCKILERLPSSLCKLRYLESLHLDGCSNLQRLPDELGNLESLEKLYADKTAIVELPSSIGCLSKLRILQLRDCKILERLPSSLCKLRSLESLHLDGCSNLQRLPDEFGNLELLENLCSDETAIKGVPSSIVCSNNLRELSFNRCRGDAQMGYLMRIISLPFDGLHRLTYLSLIDYGITELPESLGQLSSLRSLCLDKNNFERIPPSIIHLLELITLSISCCKRLQCLPELPCNIEYMDAHGCTSLEAMSGLPIQLKPHETQNIDLSNCLKLEPNEVSLIVKDAVQKIQTAWWRELVLKDRQFLDGQICYPGREIPEWFSFQSMGSLINLHLPPRWFKHRYAGFAFCAVVSFQDHHDNDGDFYESYELLVKTGENGDLYFSGIIGKGWSDHVVLGYCFCDGFESQYYYSNEVSFLFCIEGESEDPIEFCRVLKCGIHLLHAQGDCHRYSSFDEEDEPETKRFKLWNF